MVGSGFLGYVLRVYAYALPLYITWIIGIVLVWRYRDRHPGSVRLALIGLMIALFALLVFTPINALLPFLFMGSSSTANNLALYSFLSSFVQTLLQAVGWAFVIAALVRAWRSMPATYTDMERVE
ncbi:MAG TPA: hypothetical protein VFT66_22945 [Roseiflexaceae bacterium]|jgi:hypothetical protein|nr:hypothetical protein [Roseiflexaceae bacterium]